MSNNKTSDEEIINQVLAGNIDKYERLVKRYEHKLLRYASTIIRDDDAKDAVQQAFISAYRNLNSFNPKLKFSSWIYRITHNMAINIMKKNSKTITKDRDLILEYQPTNEPSHIEMLEKKQLVNLIRSNLEKIPIKYNEVLTLYYLEDKSYEEISDILRLPIGTVSTRMRRAKLSLKKLFTIEDK